jgi:hypothetical protein
MRGIEMDKARLEEIRERLNYFGKSYDGQGYELYDDAVALLAEVERVRVTEREMSILLAESENTSIDASFARYVLGVIKRRLVGGPYERDQ